jgi:hypothetical protein
MIFILSFAVFGASGVPRPFPTVKFFLLFFPSTTDVMSTFLQWAGNPAKGNVDYCNGNGALDKGA